ncbi:Holliday junction branch migration protein RuvA [Agaribacterium sp. ZY112]|uniref:Holliday junction branch migration protein RuvA n=1 Tax=Agaribacterium sp. ZY112 TaxID=3233574 RepID=UPI003523C5CA
MIGRIRGVLLEKQAPLLLVDVAGVGYELLAPMTTFFSLPELGAEVVLQTHFAVSETNQQLYAFLTKEDRELFRLLIKVNGVGPKMALAIMAMENSEFVRCVMEDQVASLVKIPGVGKKTAERLIIEMRDKLKDWSYQGAELTTTEQPQINTNLAVSEAESALVALGYKPVEASKAVSKANVQEGADAETLIRLALKSMLPG